MASVHVIVHVTAGDWQAACLLGDIGGGLSVLPGADGAVEGAGGQQGPEGVPAAIPHDLPVVLQPLDSLP